VIAWAAVLVLACEASGCGHGRYPSGYGQEGGEAIVDDDGWRWLPADGEEVTRASRWVLPALAGEDAVLFAVVADGAGGAVVAGHGSGVVRLGTQQVRLTERDAVFLARVDADGEPLWLRELEGADWSRRHESGGGLARDGAGNLYYAGTWASRDELLLVKLDGEGRVLWTWSAGSPATPDVRNHAAAVAVDAQGAITIAGSFHGRVAFGATTLTARGASDLFVARLSADGRLLWAAQAGSDAPSWEGAHGLALAGDGGAILTGRFAGAARFGEQALVTDAGAELFVAKIDATGRFVWATRAPASPIVAGYRVRLDANGAIYLCGALPLEPTVAKKPGPSCPLGSCAPTKQTPATEDLYRPGVEHAASRAVVAKLTPAGDFLWASPVVDGAQDASWANDLLVDGERVLVTGARRGAAGPQDLVLAELDAATGLTASIAHVAGSGPSAALALAPDHRGGHLVAGGFTGELMLDGDTLTSPGWSGFLWRRP
jgi:outer membrane protein assembly factor BamB